MAKTSNAGNQRSDHGEGEMVAGTSRDQKQRRPANGFLGFCNIHRPIASERNKGLENRLVTKILGCWWALLTPEEKAPYDNGAKEHKEQYMRVHPKFRWYNPPEATGNMPMTRLANRRGRKTESSALPPSRSITPGKLADESQMGGLNSLIQPSADQLKKKSLEISYIAAEHDYLKAPIVNNNTIMVGDELPCTNGGCERSVKQVEEHVSNNKQEEAMQWDESAGDDEKMSIVDDPTDEASNADKKIEIPKNGEVVKKEPAGNAKPEERGKPSLLDFKDFIKKCPVYSYDEFLKRKMATNKNLKRGGVKGKRGMTGVKKESGASPSEPGERKHLPGRRKRSVRMPPAKNRGKKPDLSFSKEDTVAAARALMELAAAAKLEGADEEKIDGKGSFAET